MFKRRMLYMRWTWFSIPIMNLINNTSMNLSIFYIIIIYIIYCIYLYGLRVRYCTQYPGIPGTRVIDDYRYRVACYGYPVPGTVALALVLAYCPHEDSANVLTPSLCLWRIINKG